MTWQARETPYADEKRQRDQRNMRKGVRPKSLPELLRWFLMEWSQETPDTMHGGGVWRSVAGNGETVPGFLTGGSLIGSPAWSDPFRRFIENRPGEIDKDGYFVRPMRAAIASLAGRDPNADSHYWGRYVWTLGCAGGAWREVAERAQVPYPLHGLVTFEVLSRLWSRYVPSPDQQREGVA